MIPRALVVAEPEQPEPLTVNVPASQAEILTTGLLVSRYARGAARSIVSFTGAYSTGVTAVLSNVKVVDTLP